MPSVTFSQTLQTLVRAGPLSPSQVAQLVVEAQDNGALLPAGRSALETALEAYGSTHFRPAEHAALRAFLDDPRRPSAPPAQWSALRPASPLVGIRVAQAQGGIKRTVTFTFDAGDHAQLKNVALNGSWDKRTGAYAEQWGAETLAMVAVGDGRFQATVELLDDGSARAFSWGVTVDGPSGNNQWAVFGEEPLKLTLDANTSAAIYAPTSYHRLGSHRKPDGDIAFGFWAPNAKNVAVKILNDDGTSTLHPMVRDADAVWTLRLDDGFAALEHKAYVYQLTTPAGVVVERRDPYARAMQGEQRGLSRVYLDRATASEVNAFTPDHVEFMRFEIDGEASAHHATLLLKDADGTVLNRQQLLARLGAFDASMNPTLSAHLRGGAFDDLWSNNVNDDGSINMTNEGGAWTTLVNAPRALEGLRYELQSWHRDPNTGVLALRDDVNRDGVLSDFERMASPNNDAWDDVIHSNSGLSFRASVVTRTDDFAWQNDAAPRERDHRKWVVYQLHVGSFFGAAMNSQRSTFDDVIKRLGYLKELGVTTIELNPTNEFEGTRDWGYMGANSLATESSYGFVDAGGAWVSGYEALKRFVDAAHGAGLNVLNDVVYNHLGGDDNQLWELDGNNNPYFNWADDDAAVAVSKNTDWGPMPAYRRPHVKQLFVDHAVMQIEELHFDGLRLDFTEPMKAQWGGGKAGWEMLREINRAVHFVRPDAFTAAEQFDYDPAMTRPADRTPQGGAGFDAQWYTQIQHDLVNNSTPFEAGVVQSAARGWTLNLERLMATLTAPRGLESWGKALSILSNHDEVGNAQRTITVAQPDAAQTPPDQYARALARFAAALTLFGPGIPFFFQGEESLASNAHRWGMPSTWDIGWQWETIGADWDFRTLRLDDAQAATATQLATLDDGPRKADARYVAMSPTQQRVVDALASIPASQRAAFTHDVHRRQMHTFFQDAIGARASSPALSADAPVRRLFVHNDNGVLAFEREAADEAYVVIGCAHRDGFSAYDLDLPAGTWREVFDSDDAVYGGGDRNNRGPVFAGTATLALPAGGVVVLKRQ